jgi:hypothetical protein
MPDEERRVVEGLRALVADVGIVARRLIAEAENAQASNGRAFELAIPDGMRALFEAESAGATG